MPPGCSPSRTLAHTPLAVTPIRKVPPETRSKVPSGSAGIETPQPAMPAERATAAIPRPTVAIPPGAQRILTGPHCPNQAYVVADRHLGLQCHVEMTPEMIESWLGSGAGELAALRALPADVPWAIEYPLAGEDLVAVTRAQVEHLRSLAAAPSGTSSSCTWAIITGSSDSA